MANCRPESMIIPPGVFDETKISNRQSLPTYGHSSSSSIDSAGGTNVNINTQNPSPQNLLRTATSSTTTDSDFESEQDDSLQLQQQKKDSNASDPLSRRAKHFYKLFKSEIPNDMPEIIDSYVCAYQGDILLQGKMYITDRYLCFHSRIINYVTKHVYRWEQIKRVTKERVAFIFPTAIGIQLKKTGKKVTYASFLQRDQAFEKILSIWSRFNNDNHSYDDDDNDTSNDGTLKATNQNEKHTYNQRESYDVIDGNEQQEVLQLCLKNNQTQSNSKTRKHSDDKPPSKKTDKKLSTKNSNENVSTNQTTRQSRYTKNEQRLSDKTKRNSSQVNYRSQSHNRDRTVSRTDQIVSHSIPSPVIQPVISNSNSNGISNTIISFLNQILKYISSYPMKTTMIIFLVLAVLFLHSFYLVKLAYRIENRLQSLYLSPSSSMKNSFSSNTKDL